MKLLIDLRHSAVPMLYSQFERVDFPYSQYGQYVDDDSGCGLCTYALSDHLWQMFDGDTVIDCEVTL